MAGLFDTIKSKSGQLAKTSTEELAAQTGLPAQPTTPVGLSTLGANPHQSKMAGASAQKASALRQSIQGTSDLDTAERQKQSRNIATTAEQSEISKSQGMQGLGGLRERVDAIAKSKLAEGAKAAATGPANITAAASKIAGVPELVGKLKSVPNSSPEYTATLNSLAQLIHPGQPLTHEEVASLVSTDIGADVAKAVSDNVTGADIIAGRPDLVESFSKAIPGVDISNMTVDQLQDIIQREMDAEMSQISNLEQKIGSEYTGEAERGAALSEARDLGAVGVTSAEGQAQSVNKQIQQGDTINFMGREVPLSTFLSDDNVAKTVAEFLSKPDSESNKKLAAENPDFTKFVTEYKDVLEHAVKELGVGVEAQQAEVEGQKKLATVDLGEGQSGTLSDEVMKSIYPSWGQMTGQALNPALSPILTTLSNNALPPADKQFLISLVNDNPEFASYLSTLSSEQINGYISNPEVKEKSRDMETVKSLRDDIPDNTATVLGFGNMSEMNSKLSEAFEQARVDGTTKQLTDKLHAAGIYLNPRGQVDVHSTNAGLQRKTPTDLKNIVNPGLRSIKSDVGELERQIGTATPLAKSVSQNVTGALDTSEEMKSLSETLKDDASTKQFVNSQTYKEASPEIKKQADDIFINNINTENDQFIDKNIPGVGGLRGLLYTLHHPGKAEKLGPEAEQVPNILRTLSADLAKAPTPAAKAHLQSTINTIQGALNENKKYIKATAANTKADRDLMEKRERIAEEAKQDEKKRREKENTAGDWAAKIAGASTPTVTKKDIGKLRAGIKNTFGK